MIMVAAPAFLARWIRLGKYQSPVTPQRFSLLRTVAMSRGCNICVVLLVVRGGYMETEPSGMPMGLPECDEASPFMP